MPPPTPPLCLSHPVWEEGGNGGQDTTDGTRKCAENRQSTGAMLRFYLSCRPCRAVWDGRTQLNILTIARLFLPPRMYTSYTHMRPDSRRFDQFLDNGCENCPFLHMKENQEQVEDCTSSNFFGYVRFMASFYSTRCLRLSGGCSPSLSASHPRSRLSALPFVSSPVALHCRSVSPQCGF